MYIYIFRKSRKQFFFLFKFLISRSLCSNIRVIKRRCINVPISEEEKNEITSKTVFNVIGFSCVVEHKLLLIE